MSKYYHDVTLDITGSIGDISGKPGVGHYCLGPYYGGVVRIVSDFLSVDFDPRNVIGKTVDCFKREIQKELERFGALNDEEFTDAVYAGFCEYMERLFSGRLNR